MCLFSHIGWNAVQDTSMIKLLSVTKLIDYRLVVKYTHLRYIYTQYWIIFNQQNCVLIEESCSHAVTWSQVHMIIEFVEHVEALS